MGIVLKFIVVALAVGIAHLLSAFEPGFSPVSHAFTPLDGQFATHSCRDVVKECQTLTTSLTGAEDFAFAGDFVYTGLADGSIRRFRYDVTPETFKTETVVNNTGGRPLGLRFHPITGDLWIADGLKGLLSYNLKTKSLKVHLDKINGEPILFADHIAITRDGKTIFMSEASTKYNVHQLSEELWEGRPHGRVTEFNTETGVASVFADNLYFANGVQLSQDEKHVFVGETFSGHVTKISRGPSGARERSVLLGSHFTDNITPGEAAGTFWLAMVGKQDPMLDRLAGSAFLRRLMRRMPLPVTPWSMGVLVNEQGKILDMYEDAKGVLATGTSVYAPYRNRLFIGTFEKQFIVVCKRD